MRNIILELSQEQEEKLRISISRQDGESLKQLLLEAFTPTVEALLQEQESKLLSDEDFEAEADFLAAELADFNSPILSDYAISREGIYEDHL